MSELAVVVVSSVVGGVVAFVGAVAKNALDIRSKVDEQLRDLRRPAYEKLWRETALVPKWPRAHVTHGQLAKFSEDLRNWYFETGGMWMSRQTQQRYASLQNVLQSVTRDKPSELVDDTGYDSVREACSRLRTAMTDDLVSRRRRSNLGV
jgi:hypothetical protein